MPVPNLNIRRSLYDEHVEILVDGVRLERGSMYVDGGGEEERGQ